MLKIKFNLKTETKTCYRFEGGEKPDFITLYLKKQMIHDAGIDPRAGITVTVEQSDNKEL